MNIKWNVNNIDWNTGELVTNSEIFMIVPFNDDDYIFWYVLEGYEFGSNAPASMAAGGAAGYGFGGDGIVADDTLSTPPPPQGQVRQYFPETWIWDTKRA